MGPDDIPDELATEARRLGLEVVRVEPARQIHSADDVTLVRRSGSTIGVLHVDPLTGRHSFVPIDGPLQPTGGGGGGEGPEPPPPPTVVFSPFCAAQHDERFGGSLVDGEWHGGRHSTLLDAESEANNHNSTTGHAAYARRYIEA